MKTYKGVKVRYSTGAKYARKYRTKTIKFENGIPPLTSLSDGGCAEFIDWKGIEKIIFSKLPERSRLLSYALISA